MNCNNGNNDGHVGSAPPAVVASPLPVKVASAPVGGGGNGPAGESGISRGVGGGIGRGGSR